ncbi:cellulose biosynthesis cyclic di-GMP-binding regulatory protein BcsB [Lentilactobacillus rapi]|uniref:cellulose biosynthesis cyclic di-GMP-binding regulatory protein BcsB n=1 Tax=Lentilactobacillus rapi TaxID=481723 RepID=UPI0024C016E1|nr:cellulose biosynthesis cyclic di-GMP-binding regulatory protein BcsB [Lentilactobacillus rapi]
MYFVKMGYWDVKRATLNLNFQVSQLSDKQISDITVSVNNVKFYSFRPKRVSGIQTKKINIPTRLLSGENNIEVSGQILNKGGHKNYQLAQTPANWLTIYKNANVNFKYQLVPPTKSVKSFYDHFTGADTIVNRDAVITTSSQPTNNELAAGMYALCGQSRVITTETDQIPVTTFNDSQAKKRLPINW